MTYKVILGDHDWPSLEIEKSVLEKHDISFEAYKNITKEELLEIANEVDALIVEYTIIDEEIIKSLKKCKIIAVNAIGVDNIDLENAAKYGIYVANVPDYCVEEVAIHAASLILSCIRKIVFLNDRVKQGYWSLNDAIPIKKCSKQTVGLVSFGKTSQRLAEILNSMSFKVMAFSQSVPKNVFEALNVEPTNTLEELLEASDVVSLHKPLTEETRNLINEDRLKMMKKNAILVNTSRGGLVDEKALYKALKDGWISGAGLDVLQEEPPDKDNPLLFLDNVVITPHTAFYSEEAMEEVRRRAAQEVVQVLINKDIPNNPVNTIKG